MNHYTQFEYKDEVFVQSQPQSQDQHQFDSENTEEFQINFNGLFDSAYQTKYMQTSLNSTKQRTSGVGSKDLSLTTIDLKAYLGTVKDLGTINTTKLSHIVVQKPAKTSGASTKQKKKLTEVDSVLSQLDLNSEGSTKQYKNLLQSRKQLKPAVQKKQVKLSL